MNNKPETDPFDFQRADVNAPVPITIAENETTSAQAIPSFSRTQDFDPFSEYMAIDNPKEVDWKSQTPQAAAAAISQLISDKEDKTDFIIHIASCYSSDQPFVKLALQGAVILGLKYTDMGRGRRLFLPRALVLIRQYPWLKEIAEIQTLAKITFEAVNCHPDHKSALQAEFGFNTK
jgi:hypothetical protein